ncbi:MAG: hypothetical protein K2V38_22375, partial [Gemmataceae bacterium]|nr:hypothetical protein [Gemmataceae bacterium]
MSFAEMVEVTRVWVAGHLPIAVGGLVAFLVLTFLAVSAARRRSPLNPSKLTAPSEKALNWAPHEQSYADRRGAVRREGQPVRVVLACASFRNGVADGYVVDRSTGGLK